MFCWYLTWWYLTRWWFAICGGEWSGVQTGPRPLISNRPIEPQNWELQSNAAHFLIFTTCQNWQLHMYVSPRCHYHMTWSAIFTARKSIPHPGPRVSKVWGAKALKKRGFTKRPARLGNGDLVFLLVSTERSLSHFKGWSKNTNKHIKPYKDTAKSRYQRSISIVHM